MELKLREERHATVCGACIGFIKGKHATLLGGQTLHWSQVLRYYISHTSLSEGWPEFTSSRKFGMLHRVLDVPRHIQRLLVPRNRKNERDFEDVNTFTLGLASGKTWINFVSQFPKCA